MRKLLARADHGVAIVGYFFVPAIQTSINIFLPDYVCCIEGCSEERCQFGNVFEDVCRRHHLPSCANPRCSHKSSPSKYCDMRMYSIIMVVYRKLTWKDSCQHKLCEKEATPLDGKPFCRQRECFDFSKNQMFAMSRLFCWFKRHPADDHLDKCMDDGCQALRTFRASDDGTLRMNDYCTAHECKDPSCRRHQCESKPYCSSRKSLSSIFLPIQSTNSHTDCCEKPGCSSKRDGHAKFLTLCYPRKLFAHP